VKEVTTATARVMPFNQQAFQHQCSICGTQAKKVVFFAKAY
jgi:prolyl-tRNA synthetase